MKTLSIRNPFSYLACLGLKNVENRSWKTPYRGKLLIHSSGKLIRGGFVEKDFPPKSMDRVAEFWDMAAEKLKNGATEEEVDQLCMEMLIPQEIDIHNLFMTDWVVVDKNDRTLHSQAIIGEVDLVDIVDDATEKGTPYYSIWAQPGNWHWIFKNPVLFKAPHKNVKGKLRIWEYEGL